MPRTGTVQRKTKETDLRVSLDLDGTGEGKADTGVPFFDHMLETLAKHAALTLEVSCKGDLHIDQHHTVEDTGIALGKALDQALGDRKGIARWGASGASFRRWCAQAANRASPQTPARSVVHRASCFPASPPSGSAWNARKRSACAPRSTRWSAGARRCWESAWACRSSSRR